MRHIGVSNFDVEQLRRIRRIAPVETLQPPYSLVAREVEGEILPFAEREGVGVIVYSPMGSGLLTGRMTRERLAAMPDDDWRKRDPGSPSRSCPGTWPSWRGWTPSRGGTTPPPARSRSRGPCATRRVDAAIVGFRRPDQVDPPLLAANLDLTAEDLAEIEGGNR